MNLVHAETGLQLELKENEVHVLVVENQTLLTRLLGELYAQSKGEHGGFVLSENYKEINLSKELQLILEPFSLDGNDRKILSKLYQELEEYALEKFPLETMQLNANVAGYIAQLCEALLYPVSFRAEMQPVDFLKLTDVKLNLEAETILETVVEYLGVVHHICHTKVFAFLHLKTFLSDSELQQLYEYAFYNKIQLFLIESTAKMKLTGEKITIIDKDCCIIDL